MVRPPARKGRVRSFLEAIAKTGPVTEFTPLSFTSNDDGDVMVFLRYAFTVAVTGKSAAMNMHHYWKSVAGRRTSSAAPKTPRKSPPR